MINDPNSAPGDREADTPILDDELLRRRLLRHAGWFRRDGSMSPYVFLDRTTPAGEVSVHREHVWTIQDITSRYPEAGVAQVVARVPRAYQHDVNWAPEEDDPSHTLLAPQTQLDTDEKRKEAARRIAQAAEIVVPIPKPRT